MESDNTQQKSLNFNVIHSWVMRFVNQRRPKLCSSPLWNGKQCGRRGRKVFLWKVSHSSGGKKNSEERRTAAERNSSLDSSTKLGHLKWKRVFLFLLFFRFLTRKNWTIFPPFHLTLLCGAAHEGGKKRGEWVGKIELTLQTGMLCLKFFLRT